MSLEEHLLNEIKRELDWAVNEVKRSENEVMRLEVEFNRQMEDASPEEKKRLTEEKEHLQSRIGLSETYALQRNAARRFFMLSHVYDIASTHKSSETVREQLSLFMYRAMDGEAQNADQKDKLLELAEAMMAYFADGHSDEADEAIREAWQNIEEILRELGRKT